LLYIEIIKLKCIWISRNIIPFVNHKPLTSLLDIYTWQCICATIRWELTVSWKRQRIMVSFIPIFDQQHKGPWFPPHPHSYQGIWEISRATLSEPNQVPVHIHIHTYISISLSQLSDKRKQDTIYGAQLHQGEGLPIHSAVIDIYIYIVCWNRY